MSAARPKHIPERTCVACRRKRPQGEFRRLSRGAGGWTLGVGKVRTGRGLYLCADLPACWTEKKLRRAFGAQAPAVAALLGATESQPGMKSPEHL